MAATDITSKDTLIKGVNQDTNFIKQRAYIIDCAEDSGLLTVETHDLVKLPAGEMLTKVRVLVLTSAASEGAATLQFKAKFNSTSEALASASGIANFAANDVASLSCTGIKGYDKDYGCVVQMTVGTAALTAFKFMLIVESVPVSEFLNRG